MLRYLAVILLLVAINPAMYAQEKGQLSGDLVLNASAYDYDSTIGTNTTQYFHELYSAEGWLTLNYRIQGFAFSVRYDMYQNSPLLNPQEAYTKQGIGFYSASKQFKKFGVTAGSFYDQIGSGIIYRSYEDRTIGLDYATQGIRLNYNPNDSFMVKAFTGLQKDRFEVHPQVIKGINTEKAWNLGPFGMRTGLGLVNRTLDQETMRQLADIVNSRPLEERFIPKYNVFAATAYNTIYWKDLSLYLEYAKKSKEAVFITQPDGSQDLQNLDGDVKYASLNYSFSGFGINLQYKDIRTFVLRTDPYAILLQGVINFLPPLSRQHSFRLPARYSISALSQGETGYQAEITYSPNNKNSFLANVSYIHKPTGERLFREYYLDYTRKFSKHFKGLFGLQSVIYDQEVYEGKPLAPMVQTITPFVELSYRFPKAWEAKKLFSKSDVRTTLRPSIRTELQYLQTHQDIGDLAWALLELNLAPKYSIAVSDMVNTKPKAGQEMVHYYSAMGFYTYEQTRLSFGYVKQVQGVVCTGGVCRVEPAFSGLKFGLTTNF